MDPENDMLGGKCGRQCAAVMTKRSSSVPTTKPRPPSTRMTDRVHWLSGKIRYRGEVFGHPADLENGAVDQHEENRFRGSLPQLGQMAPVDAEVFVHAFEHALPVGFRAADEFR